jgi:U6 snRNA-associated Sm-like protein LSm4
MLVELKTGETLNGHLVSCDTYMNITLKEVVQTSPEGDKFFRLPECYVRGNNVRYGAANAQWHFGQADPVPDQVFASARRSYRYRKGPASKPTVASWRKRGPEGRSWRARG